MNGRETEGLVKTIRYLLQEFEDEPYRRKSRRWVKELARSCGSTKAEALVDHFNAIVACERRFPWRLKKEE